MLHRIIKYRDEDVNKSDLHISMFLHKYDKLRRREEDKMQELTRNRKIVQAKLKQQIKKTHEFAPLSKDDEFVFEKVEMLLMHQKPLFKIYPTAEKRLVSQHEEPKSRVIQEKLCKCCQNLVKKHVCQHTKCPKPCIIQEKREKKKARQQQERQNAQPDNEM